MLLLFLNSLCKLYFAGAPIYWTNSFFFLASLLWCIHQPSAAFLLMFLWNALNLIGVYYLCNNVLEIIHSQFPSYIILMKLLWSCSMFLLLFVVLKFLLLRYFLPLFGSFLVFMKWELISCDLYLERLYNFPQRMTFLNLRKLHQQNRLCYIQLSNHT